MRRVLTTNPAVSTARKSTGSAVICGKVTAMVARIPLPHFHLGPTHRRSSMFLIDGRFRLAGSVELSFTVAAKASNRHG